MPSLRNSVLAALLSLTSARDIPPNVQNFYNSIRAQKQCKHVLSSNFHSVEGDSGSFTYCGDHLSDYNVVYIQGRNGELANMDIDCDGVQNGPADDGRCGSSGDTQSVTSFRELVASYGAGQKDLDANAHPYVVFGNAGSKPDWPQFSPRQYDIQPLSLMAVVCNNKLIYGVWGEENGDDGSQAMVGEASISLATACFGNGINGGTGHNDNDVLYIAFRGGDAVPGAEGAKWDAQNYNDFEASITSLGDKLIQRIGSSDSAGSSTSPATACPWPGHYAGLSATLLILLLY